MVTIEFCGFCLYSCDQAMWVRIHLPLNPPPSSFRIPVSQSDLLTAKLRERFHSSRSAKSSLQVRTPLQISFPWNGSFGSLSRPTLCFIVHTEMMIMSSLIQPRSAIQRHTFAASWGFTAIARPRSKTEGGRERTAMRRGKARRARRMLTQLIGACH
ncbi:uncharacterized [Tachysurus ichikawai]